MWAMRFAWAVVRSGSHRSRLACSAETGNIWLTGFSMHLRQRNRKADASARSSSRAACGVERARDPQRHKRVPMHSGSGRDASRRHVKALASRAPAPHGGPAVGDRRRV
jgi:hypothetical protein